MFESLPRFLLLGGPLPEAAVAGLRDVVTLDATEDATAPADGILVPARPEVLPAIRRFRDAGGRLPIFAVSPTPVTITERLAWIGDGGVNDVLAADTAGEALARKLRSETWRPSAPPSGEGNEAGARVDRWLRAASRYLEAREALLAGLGPRGRARFLDTTFLRDKVLRAGDGDFAADPFGHRRGSEGESLSWPVNLLAPVATSGHLENIGADGACLALANAPGPGERLHISVVGERVAATLALDVLWQRRIGRGRWQVGALALACTIESHR